MLFNLYTIGHSTHSVEQFIGLLSMYSVNVVADVRSYPYSRYNPQFNRENFKDELIKFGMQYVFLGQELGARSKDPKHYQNGKVQYSSLALSPQFGQGLNRIQTGLKAYRIALMCAEKDPIVCHRAILICRYLRSNEISIEHIREDGTFETSLQLEERLLRLFELPDHDLFTTRSEMIERAYDLQSERIAYAAPQGEQDDEAAQEPALNL